MITRGTGRTYRFFDESAALAKNTSVAAYTRYKFGYGLSYCTYIYSGLTLTAQADGSVAIGLNVAAVGPVGRACREVSQVYLTLPPAPGVATPLLSLVAFASTPLAANAPPTALRFVVGRDDLLTTAVDGSRALAGGVYSFAASGHQPGDTKGATQSNVVTATITLSP